MAPEASYFTAGSGVYQSDTFNGTSTLTGLGSVLTPDTKYTLDLFSQVIFGGTQNVTYHYGSETGTVDAVNGNALVSFTITTGATVGDTLTFNSTDPTSGFGGFTGFAIVSEGQIPEPSTYALMLGGLVMLGVVALRRRVS